MNQFYFSINPNPQTLIQNNESLFFSLVIVAFTLSGMFYFIFTRPKYGEIKSESKHKRGVVISLIILILVLGLAYYKNWSVFYQIDIKNQKLCLSYFYPKRTVEVSIDQLKTMNQVSSNKQSYLQIELTSGKKLNSAKMNSWNLNKNYQSLQQAIISQFKSAKK